MVGLFGVILALAGIVVAILAPLEIERRKRPIVTIERSGDLNDPNAQPSGFRIVHICVTNNRLSSRWLLRNDATGCRVDVTFRSRSDGKTVHIPGRWSGHPQPLDYHVLPTGQIATTFRPEAVPPTLTFDLSPDPDGQNLGIAIKRQGDTSAYAFTSSSYANLVTLCLPEYELPDTEYDVTVRAHAGQLEWTQMFVLRNTGQAYTGFSLIDSE
jgi:hypothetical protein